MLCGIPFGASGFAVVRCVYVRRLETRELKKKMKREQEEGVEGEVEMLERKRGKKREGRSLRQATMR